MAVCFAVISSDNRPIYIKTCQDRDPLFYHFKVHTTLDIIEDKIGQITSGRGIPTPTVDQYLGLLYPTEDHRLYGYVTNTRIKFVIIEEADATNKRLDVRAKFQTLHNAYIKLVSSPFYSPNTPIQDSGNDLNRSCLAFKKFDDEVSKILCPPSTKNKITPTPALRDAAASLLIE